MGCGELDSSVRIFKMAAVAMVTRQEKAEKIKIAPNMMKLYRNIKWDVGTPLKGIFGGCGRLLCLCLHNHNSSYYYYYSSSFFLSFFSSELVRKFSHITTDPIFMKLCRNIYWYL